MQPTDQITLDLPALKTPSMFLVGYGLDYQEQYRQLPFIVTLEAI